CWGSGQQDARAAQGTMRMLGAATRKKRKPFQIVLPVQPAPHLQIKFASFLRFTAIFSNFAGM
ncbi:hypothetical protein, partial [Faecalibacterium tardum]